MVTFLIAVIGRFVKRLLQGNKRGVLCLYYAIKDYNTGMSGITSVPADEKWRKWQRQSPDRLLFPYSQKFSRK